MPEYRVKDPTEGLDYSEDWTTWLIGEPAFPVPDTIATSSWTVDPGITVGATTHDATSATIWLSGGTLGERYAVANTITTAGGRTAKRTTFIDLELR